MSRSFFGESLQYTQYSDFYKAIYAIRGKGSTKGMACAVNYGGQVLGQQGQDNTRDSVCLVTSSDCVGEFVELQSVKADRYSRTKMGSYQLEISNITQSGNFSFLLVNGDQTQCPKRLGVKYLTDEEQKRDFIVHTISALKGHEKPTLKYNQDTEKYNLIIPENLFDFSFRGSPIIVFEEGEEYFVGVLKESDPDQFNPFFITEEHFDNLEPVGGNPGNSVPAPGPHAPVPGPASGPGSAPGPGPAPVVGHIDGSRAHDHPHTPTGTEVTRETPVERSEEARRGFNLTTSLAGFFSFKLKITEKGVAALFVCVGVNLLAKTVTAALEKWGTVGPPSVGSILVELQCNTKESFLSFVEDFITKKVKQRLEEEFKKVGCEVELEVAITNYKEVQEKLEQIRKLEQVKSEEVVGETPATVAGASSLGQQASRGNDTGAENGASSVAEKQSSLQEDHLYRQLEQIIAKTDEKVEQLGQELKNLRMEDIKPGPSSTEQKASRSNDPGAESGASGSSKQVPHEQDLPIECTTESGLLNYLFPSEVDIDVDLKEKDASTSPALQTEQGTLSDLKEEDASTSPASETEQETLSDLKEEDASTSPASPTEQKTLAVPMEQSDVFPYDSPVTQQEVKVPMEHDYLPITLQEESQEEEDASSSPASPTEQETLAEMTVHLSLASEAPSFPSTKETTNFARLCRLIVNAGSQVLKEIFDRIHSPDTLHKSLSNPAEYATLQSLQKKGDLNPLQWDKLYPAIGSSVSSTNFDFPLLMVLLRNICGLTPPATGWDNRPLVTDVTREADVARIGFYRSQFLCQTSQASVDDVTFEKCWADVRDALVRLGGKAYGIATDDLKDVCMDADIDKRYIEIFKLLTTGELIKVIDLKEGVATGQGPVPGSLLLDITVNPGLREQLAFRLQLGRKIGVIPSWMQLCRELEVDKEVVASLELNTVFSPTNGLFEYLSATQSELTFGQVKRVLSEIGRNDLVYLLTREAACVDSEKVCKAMNFDLREKIFSRLDLKSRVARNWRSLAIMFGVPREACEYFATPSRCGPFKHLFDYVQCAYPEIPFKRMEEALERMNTKDGLYIEEQLNYFRICYLVTDVLSQGLRAIFKQEWDSRYKTTLGEWTDTPKNGKDFYIIECPRNQRRNARLLATMMSGNREEWNCTMLFYAILHSDSIHGLSPEVRNGVDHLRMFRNEFAHTTQAPLTDQEFTILCDKVEAAFQSLGLSLLPIQNVRQQQEFTTEQLNYFRMCYIVTDVLPGGLRVIFKQEWDSRYTTKLEKWEDTPKNGKDFYHGESLRNKKRNARLLATMMNGNRDEWDCTMLFYAILHSDTINGLSPEVRSGVNDLREFVDELETMEPKGRLSETEFEHLVHKVHAAFESLSLSTSQIQDISEQLHFPTSGSGKVVEERKHQSLEEQPQSFEYEHDVSSFCSLPLKPPHDIIVRDGDKDKIEQELNKLKNTSENGLSCLIISGSSGSGKSQLARQVANSFYNDATKTPDAAAFVMALNAESSESLLDSYISFANQAKCSEVAVDKILETAGQMTHDEKITKLKDLIEQKLHLYTTWLLVADNVTGVSEMLKLLPEPGNERWKTGQMLITTRDTVSDLPVNSFTSHISIDNGMEPNDAISLLAAVSGTDDKEMPVNVAMAMYYQPLALVSAARYVRQGCESNKEPKVAWAEFLKKLGTCKESFIKSVRTPEPSNLTSTKVTARLAVEAMISASNVIKQAFAFLSLCKRQLLKLDVLINYVQNVEQDQDKEQITKAVQACPLLLLEREKNSISVYVHVVVFDAIRSVLPVTDGQLEAAVRAFKQDAIDPLEESWDKFNEAVDSDRLIPLLRDVY